MLASSGLTTGLSLAGPQAPGLKIFANQMESHKHECGCDRVYTRMYTRAHTCVRADTIALAHAWTEIDIGGVVSEIGKDLGTWVGGEWNREGLGDLGGR